MIAYSKEEGKEEGKLLVAKTMLEKGMDVETVASLTGLSVEQIQSLRAVCREMPQAQRARTIAKVEKILTGFIVFLSNVLSLRGPQKRIQVS